MRMKRCAHETFNLLYSGQDLKVCLAFSFVLYTFSLAIHIFMKIINLSEFFYLCHIPYECINSYCKKLIVLA